MCPSRRIAPSPAGGDHASDSPEPAAADSGAAEASGSDNAAVTAAPDERDTVRAGACQDRFNTELARESVQFSISRADIRPVSLPLLDRLAAVARECGLRVAIAGHTDSRGDAAMNDALSLARAESVRAYLIEQGADGALIGAVGMGSRQPVGDNETIAGRQQNRRIEFIVLGATPTTRE